MKHQLSVPSFVPGRTGSFALAVLCITVVLAAGCTGTQETQLTPVNTLTPLTSASSGTSASGLSYDPIVGVWRSPGAIYKFEITFDVNGKTQENYASVPNVFYNGTWTALGNDMYLVTRDSGEKNVWVHDLSANTLYKKETPAIVYTLYQGVGRASAAPGGSTVVSGEALLSGNRGQHRTVYRDRVRALGLYLKLHGREEFHCLAHGRERQTGRPSCKRDRHLFRHEAAEAGRRKILP